MPLRPSGTCGLSLLGFLLDSHLNRKVHLYSFELVRQATVGAACRKSTASPFSATAWPTSPSTQPQQLQGRGSQADLDYSLSASSSAIASAIASHSTC